MKRAGFVKILLCSVILLNFLEVRVPAQMRQRDRGNQVRVTGWVDDSHYIFQTLDAFKEIRLTSDASEKVYNGYSSWVYMEEILGRQSRYAAFWFSPDSKNLALQVDNRDQNDLKIILFLFAILAT